MIELGPVIGDTSAMFAYNGRKSLNLLSDDIINNIKVFEIILEFGIGVRKELRMEEYAKEAPRATKQMILGNMCKQVEAMNPRLYTADTWNALM